ncbi:MAG: CBS domain-containing protein [Pseudomonadota bacterium]
MSTQYTVNDYMRQDLVTLSIDMDISKAIESFVDSKISGAPVIDEHGMLIGMLSEADCIKAYISCVYNSSGSGCGHVAEFMSTQLHTLTPSADLIEAANLFMQHNLRRIPVVSYGRLVGQLSRHNLLKAIHDNDWA